MKTTCALISRVMFRVIPQQTELTGKIFPHLARHLAQVIREVTEIPERFEQDCDAVTIHIAAAMRDQLQVGCGQEKMSS